MNDTEYRDIQEAEVKLRDERLRRWNALLVELEEHADVLRRKRGEKDIGNRLRELATELRFL